MQAITLVMTSIILQTFLLATGVDAVKCYSCDEGRPGAKKDVKCDNKIVVDCGAKKDVACLKQFPNPHGLLPGETAHVIKKCSSIKDRQNVRDESEEEVHDNELGHLVLRRFCTTDLCNK